MRSASNLRSAFRHAQSLHAKGQLKEAESVYLQLATSEEYRESVLSALAELYMQARRPADAVGALQALAENEPDSLYHCARLASLLDGLGQQDAAIRHYERLLERQPGLSAAHFNVALLYRKELRYGDALASYREAVRLGIRDVQEVYSNMGVVYSEMRQGDEARRMYERALEVDPAFIPALFNLAGLLEETGERERSIELYRHILSINPKHRDSLARLAYVNRIGPGDEYLLDEIRVAIDGARDDTLAQEGLYFAASKALDDLGRYDEAFAAGKAANELGKQRNPPYERGRAEEAFDRLIELYDATWIRDNAVESPAAPVFICGMFRSGSTLVEQILAGHPSVTAGGELEFLPWLIARKLAPYPERIKSVSRDELRQLGTEYLARVQELLPQSEVVTDKRPDNFLHLGLIKALFPSARIVYTRRNPLDNYLSIYFQQLGGNLSYATALEDIAHYYTLHERLIDHWRGCFGDDIFTVDYDSLVASPEPVVRKLLRFLGLAWDSRCLDFKRTGALVKTASVWQVRENLHTRSSGRWRNYELYVRDLGNASGEGSG